MNIFLVRRCLQSGVGFITSGLQLQQRAANERFRDWHFVAVIRLNVRVFENEIGSFTHGGLVQFFTLEEFVSRFNLVRNI
jgi:hypothetical protein